MNRAGGRLARMLGAALMMAGCGLVGGPTTFHADVPDVMTVTSPDVNGRSVLAATATCHGGGTHPNLEWSGAPPGTKSLAVVMDDAAGPAAPYIYWIVFDIAPQASGITGPIPEGARQARNSKGSIGYDPPCPSNHLHTYRFTVYALSSALSLRSGATVITTWTDIARTAIARGSLSASVAP